MFEFEVKGTGDVQRRLVDLMRRLPDAVATALYEEAQIEMTESKKRCPVAPDGGTLRSSGHVEAPVVTGQTVSVRMAYGGPAIPYALAVHEHPSKHDPPSWRNAEFGVTFNVGGPKFLESVVLESKNFMAARVAKRIDVEKLVG